MNGNENKNEEGGVAVDETDVNNALTETEPEIDYSKLDPSKIPHEVVRQTPAFSGVLGEVQGLRESNQDYRERMEALAAQQNQQRETDEFEGRELDEEITLGDANKLVEKAIAKYRASRQKEQEQTEQQRAANVRRQSEQSLLAKYPVDKAPAGLDAVSVLQIGGAWLKTNKPDLFAAAYKTNDPAQEIYDLATNFCPALKAKAQTIQNEQLLDSINTGTIPKHGAGSMTDAQVDTNELEKLLAMPEDQLLDAAMKDELG